MRAITSYIILSIPPVCILPKRNIPLTSEGRGIVYGGRSCENGTCPTGQFLNVLFEHLTINHSEEQARLLVINRVVINISSFYKTAHSLAIKDGLVVARNDFGDRHIVATFHNTSGNTRSVDGRMICGYEEETNKERVCEQ